MANEINMDPLQKQMLDDVFDAFTMLSNGGIISLMHVDGGFTRYTASAVELFGLPGEYIPNGAMDWTDWVHPEDRKRYLDIMMPLIEGMAQTYDLIYRVRTVNQGYVPFRLVGAVLRGSDGKPSLIGGAMFNDELANNTDPVTMLPNKSSYFKDIKHMMDAGKATVTMQVGVTRFSEINTLHGFSYGNRLLQEIGWLLQETVEDRAKVYRLDDASFGLLFETVSKEETAAIYDHIRYSFQRGIEVNGIRNILVCAGGLVTTYNAESSPETVYSCLNYAYRESRQHGHGDLVDFNGNTNQSGQKTLEMINAIRDSVLEDCRGFSMVYEPVVSVQKDWMNGAEASICWEDEVYGKVSGSRFLPVLERDFVYEELGEFILRRSLEDGVRFLEKDPNFLLCVDVYRMQLETDYFVDDLTRMLEQTGFPPAQLSLNLMGDYRSIDPDQMARIVRELHEKNILIIIDNFGSGTDSIGFLKSYPVDAVSLDVRFVEGIEKEGRDRDILQHLTHLASDCVDYINIKGVSSERICQIVKSFPITTLQGSFFSQPVTAEDILGGVYGGVFQKES